MVDCLPSNALDSRYMVSFTHIVMISTVVSSHTIAEVHVHVQIV